MSKLHITVFDTDGGNPYGREVAALLQVSGYHVEAILPSDTGWLPDGLKAQLCLPANGKASGVAQIGRQLHGIVRTVVNALFRRHMLVVIMTRSWYDQLALGLLARCGVRVILVAHDPVPKIPLPGYADRVRRFFWRAARVRVTHSEPLAVETMQVCNMPAMVVPHLPFHCYAEWTKSVASLKKPEDAVRLLVLGQMRADKGLERLPAILSHLSPAVRGNLRLGFAGRGKMSSIEDEIAQWIQVTRPVSRVRLNDHDIAAALNESDILLAPYPVVSASGSVVLALCCGLGVIAYDSGAIGDVLDKSGLVPSGDERAFSSRIEQAMTDGGGQPRIPLAQWRAQAQAAWIAAVETAAA
ncbi:MAG: glycosyltransferase [Beijerinckiaceae bacterium]